jgi:aspartate/methionine/tyrosine aminotransferase
MVDHRAFGYEDDVAFCKHLIEDVGVAAIPPSTFYIDPKNGKDLVRFAFCKDEETLRTAVERLKANLKRPALSS